MPLTLSIGLLSISASLWVSLAVFAWRQRAEARPYVISAVACCLSIAQWSLTYALELATQDPMLKLVAHHTKYLGMTALPLSAFVFAVQYADKNRWLSPRRRTLLLVPFIITMLMVVTNSSHGWMWPSLTFTHVGELTVVSESQGVWAWVNTLYLYALGVTAFGILFQHVRATSMHNRRHYVSIVIGLVPPLLASLIVTLGLSPISWTTFAFGLTAVVIGWGLTRLSLFDILPIANRTVIEHMPDGMIVLDHKERIISVNPAALWMFGRDKRALLGQPASTLESFGISLAAIHQEKAELTITTDGWTLHLEMHASPLTSQADGRPGRVLLLRDITERKRAEGLLKQALIHEQELNAVKSRFVSVVSHEFRTPLAVIGTTTYLLRTHMRKMPPDTIMTKLQVIENQVQAINELFEDVLTLSRIQTDRVQFDSVQADIVATARALIDELFPTQADRVVWQTPSTPVEMALDKQLLRLMLSNLVSNALKYSGSDQPVYLSIDTAGDEVRVRVRDEGIGIPEEDRAHLFEPFFRAGNVGMVQGSGLGLSIVKEAAELHGGRIALVSDGASGSEFLLSLPLRAAPRQAASAEVGATDLSAAAHQGI